MKMILTRWLTTVLIIITRPSNSISCTVRCLSLLEVLRFELGVKHIEVEEELVLVVL